MKCSIMHIIWVFTVCGNTCLGVSGLQMVDPTSGMSVFMAVIMVALTSFEKKSEHTGTIHIYLYPRYEAYRGYIVFTSSVIVFVCLFVCL